MQSRRWLGMAVMGLVCVVAISGCSKKKKTTGTGLDEGGIGGMTGVGIEEGTLGSRPGEGVLEGAGGQFTPVYFDYDSSQVKDSERPALDAVASYLQQGSAGGIIVEGNCDERGSTEYNLALGERRALAVRAYLVGLGIDGNRVQTRSYGEEKPVCSEQDDSCWSRNRRAEFITFQ